jgi:UDP-arabinose 4-epimerase
MTNRVLVTGGAGYIGSHTCKMLRRHGYEPITYDNLVYGHAEAVRWGPFERGDIGDGIRLSEVFARYQPRAVIHFAAFAYVGESMHAPGKYYRNNVIGSIELLEAMRGNGCELIVFSSSCATYGLPETVPIAESAPQQPISPYGRSKRMVEQILADYDLAYGIKHINLRYFNAAGADPEGETGEDHTPETHLVPLVLQTAAGIREHIEVYGDDYDTPDGTAIRDYVHVTDLADAHVRALRYLENEKKSDAFNLGSGTGISVREVIDTAESVCCRPVPVSYGPRRPGDPPMLVADAAKARRRLGWQPSHSEIEMIVETAWAWLTGSRW